MTARRPLVEELPDPPGPAEAFEALREKPYGCFLDSGMDPARLGRYSFVCADPFLVLRSRGTQATLLTGGEERAAGGDPFRALGDLLDAYRLAAAPCPLPFTGGAVGYLGYDLGRTLERIPSIATDDLALPECYLGFYDVVIGYDHLAGRAYAVSCGFPASDELERMERARVRLEAMKARLSRARAKPGRAALPERLSVTPNFTHDAYLRAIQRTREYIIAGDIFQANISQRFEAEWRTPAYDLYQRLRSASPVPFAAFLDFEGVSVASASPERFLRVDGDRVETRPIKGTRPRGKTADEDAALAKALLDSEKDRAENVMIVDLERNDLGRVCRYGTVRVTELCALEKFPTVFHLTSTVEGRLGPGKGLVDLLRAAFPGGSITGAPKVRAMEIIEELEPTRRGVYTGSIGYLGFDGTADLNIAIRTAVVKDGRAYYQAGGGIVYDSEPEAEYQETLHKARAFFRAIGVVYEPARTA